MQVLSRQTPKALHTVAQGRSPSRPHPGLAINKRMVTPKGVKQNDAYDRLCSAFGVNNSLISVPGCAASRRPRATVFNRFAVYQRMYLHNLGEGRGEGASHSRTGATAGLSSSAIRCLHLAVWFTNSAGNLFSLGTRMQASPAAAIKM